MLYEDARVMLIQTTEEVASHPEVSLSYFMRCVISATIELVGYLTNSLEYKRLAGLLGGP